jgi:hypothetical protein
MGSRVKIKQLFRALSKFNPEYDVSVEMILNAGQGVDETVNKGKIAKIVWHKDTPHSVKLIVHDEAN